MQNPNISLDDIYGTSQTELIGPLVAEHFKPGVFIDVEAVKKETDDYNKQLSRFLHLSKGDFNGDQTI